MVLQTLFKNLIFLSVVEIFEMLPTQIYCVVCLDASKRHLVEYRFCCKSYIFELLFSFSRYANNIELNFCLMVTFL